MEILQTQGGGAQVDAKPGGQDKYGQQTGGLQDPCQDSVSIPHAPHSFPAAPVEGGPSPYCRKFLLYCNNDSKHLFVTGKTNKNEFLFLSILPCGLDETGGKR